MNSALIWILPAALALVDWAAVGRGDKRTETWAKPATLVALIGTSLALGAADTTAGGWLVAALVLGLLGDVMLLSDTTARFQAGLGAFLLGHLAYLVCFVLVGLDEPRWAMVGILLTAVALGVGRDVLPATHRSGGPVLSVPVAVYMLVITTMNIAAWATGHWLIALGASIFVASDTILSVNRFVRPLARAKVAIMVTYHLGQALIVLGVLAVQ